MRYDYDDLAMILDQDLEDTAMTFQEIRDDILGVPNRVARVAIAHHRLNVSDHGKALILQHLGSSQSPLYVVTGDPVAIRRYAAFRIHDAEARLETTHGCVRGAVRITDGRSSEGRRARLIEKHTGRLLEDISDTREMALF
jgi:hypothetical protein